MTQLLTEYRLEQVILIIILAAFAVKEIISFLDWSKARTKQALQEKETPAEMAKNNQEQLENLKQQISSVNNQIQLLVKSNKDMIRHSLTKDHHYFCYKLKSIDDYSLQCMEEEYADYTEQGGNSFISHLMDEVRQLPRRIEQENR